MIASSPSSTMNLQYKNSHEALTPALRRKIEQKLTKLAPTADDPQSDSHAFFELNQEVGSHQTGDIWRASINLDSEGTRFFASQLADTPEKAADLAIREITTELRRARGKKRALVKRGGGIFKSLQQRFRSA